MKIDDIIRKCIEIPGVSIKRSEFSAELLMKTKEGKGSMTFFQLFPGLTIAYIFINSPISSSVVRWLRLMRQEESAFRLS